MLRRGQLHLSTMSLPIHYSGNVIKLSDEFRLVVSSHVVAYFGRKSIRQKFSYSWGGMR